MKKLPIAAAVAPLAGLLMLSAPFAQDVTMGDQTISAEQLPAVEDWCKELQAQQGLTGTNEPETSISDEQAETATGSQGAEEDGGIDLTTVTLEMCQEAGLTDTEGD
jgi:hypothetical protein